MPRMLVMAAAVAGLLGVALGAFGVHAIRDRLVANDRLDTYETAVQYHLIHAVALLGAAWVAQTYPSRWTRWAGVGFIAGIFLFSGSLYLLAIFNLRFMGAVAPLGGASFLIGWALLGLAAWQSRSAP
jgi:uncharacterized membrane protein YgdD (TMEM256/DUF423 family)